MNMNDQDRKKYDSQKVIQELSRRGVYAPVCPFCNGKKFSIAGEFATINVSNELGAVNLNMHIPSAVLICEKCGNLQFFSLAKLGLMGGKVGDEK